MRTFQLWPVVAFFCAWFRPCKILPLLWQLPDRVLCSGALSSCLLGTNIAWLFRPAFRAIKSFMLSDVFDTHPHLQKERRLTPDSFQTVRWNLFSHWASFLTKSASSTHHLHKLPVWHKVQSDCLTVWFRLPTWVLAAEGAPVSLASLAWGSVLSSSARHSKYWRDQINKLSFCLRLKLHLNHFKIGAVASPLSVPFND